MHIIFESREKAFSRNPHCAPYICAPCLGAPQPDPCPPGYALARKSSWGGSFVSIYFMTLFAPLCLYDIILYFGGRGKESILSIYGLVSVIQV